MLLNVLQVDACGCTWFNRKHHGDTQLWEGRKYKKCELPCLLSAISAFSLWNLHNTPVHFNVLAISLAPQFYVFYSQIGGFLACCFCLWGRVRQAVTFLLSKGMSLLVTNAMNYAVPCIAAVCCHKSRWDHKAIHREVMFQIFYSSFKLFNWIVFSLDYIFELSIASIISQIH